MLRIYEQHDALHVLEVCETCLKEITSSVSFFEASLGVYLDSTAGLQHFLTINQLRYPRHTLIRATTFQSADHPPSYASCDSKFR